VQINVSQLLREPTGSSRDIEIDEIFRYPEDDLVLPVKGNFKLTRTNRSILVKGNFKTSTQATCVRCLEDFDCPLEVTFEEEFFPPLDIASTIEIPDPEESEGFVIDERRILDLSEAVRQYALLTIPMKPLCDNNCRGF